MNKDDFKLKKFKKTEAGVLIGYQEKVTLSNGVQSTSNTTKTYKEDPHPDLIAALKDFDEIVMYDEDYKKTAEIRISGITIFPEIETCMLTHLKKTESGNTARNSGKIAKESETYKLAVKCFDLIDILTNEVFAFVYEGKRAQLAMFDVDPNEIETEAEEIDPTGKKTTGKKKLEKAMEVA